MFNVRLRNLHGMIFRRGKKPKPLKNTLLNQ